MAESSDIINAETASVKQEKKELIDGQKEKRAIMSELCYSTDSR